jgi:hypothetical protein
MAQLHPAWLEYRRKYFIRPDGNLKPRANAHLWIRHDAYRFMPPGSPRYVGKDVVRYFWPEACDQPHAGENAIAPTEWDSDYAELLQMKAELAEIKRELEIRKLLRLRSELAAIKAELTLRSLLRKAGFKPNQPRWPKGSGENGGRWSGGTAAPNAQATARPIRGGHHFVPRKLFEKEPLQPETRRIFEDAVTGPLNAGPHRGGREHDIYTDAVIEHYRRFLNENRITSEEMTSDQARKFVDEAKRSTDPRIRGFNMRIYMREIMYWFRRIPRGNE